MKTLGFTSFGWTGWSLTSTLVTTTHSCEDITNYIFFYQKILDHFFGVLLQENEIKYVTVINFRRTGLIENGHWNKGPKLLNLFLLLKNITTLTLKFLKKVIKVTITFQ